MTTPSNGKLGRLDMTGRCTRSPGLAASAELLNSNADGTTTAHTLTELRITSINLKADLTHITYVDGSAIPGQTTFTKADGSTGTVANTSLAYDGNGRAVTTTSATDATGTVSATSTGLNSDGSIAFIDTSTTSADGSAITTTYDQNGDGRAAAGNARQKGPVDLFEQQAPRAILRGAGLVDHIQVITTSTDVLGTRTETITNTSGGHVLLDSIQTITSSDGANVTINRDTTGGGWVAANDNFWRVRWSA